MTFALSGMEVQSGFAWQPETGTIYLAGRELYVDPGKPPAQLYRSTDGGLTFEAPLPSGAEGPRYRCLAIRGNRLYACAGEPGDSFLVGHSDDGGRTWTPMARLGDLEGQRPCPGNACLSTALWLCQFYGAACEGLGALDGGSIDAVDAGSLDGGADLGGGSDGCGCRTGGTAPAPAALPLILMMGLAGLFAARRPRRRP
jgi:MYXO-CTERM domain-containing protein